MPSLQSAFRDATLGNSDAALAALVVADDLAPERRIAIHRNHQFTTLTEALAATFPVVQRLVDRRFFAYAAHRYIEASPPTQPCLFEYGATFPAFLADFPACRTLPYLPDVARLEWAINCAYHADDAPVLMAEDLIGLAPQAHAAITFERHPSARVVGSRFAIDAIWRANQPGADPAMRVDAHRGGAVILVYRRELDVEWRRLTHGEHTFLRWVTGGRSLAEASHAAAAVAVAEFDLAETLAMLIAAGVFGRFRLT